MATVYRCDKCQSEYKESKSLSRIAKVYLPSYAHTYEWDDLFELCEDCLKDVKLFVTGCKNAEK